MKRSIFLLRNLLLIALMAFSASMAIADNEFCWKDSYGRGVGTIPTECSGAENQAGLCYSACKPGFNGVGPVCWSGCPAGYTDHGAVCHINKPLTKDPEWVCTAWFPDWMGGECRWKDTRCPADYTNAGLFCALTSAGKSAPPGFSGTFLDPMKNSYGRGAGTIPKGCSSGKENDAGLCYTKCQAGNSGIGPVCWGQPPPAWVQCGMGAAKSSATCGEIVFGQVASVGQMAITIGSLGTSTSLTAGMDAATSASKLAKLTQQYSKMKVAFDLAKKTNKNVQYAVHAYDAANAGSKTYTAVGTGMDAVTEEDMVRMAAQIAAIMDPTGVADTVAAYTYPKCSKYFSTAAAPATPSTPVNTPSAPANPSAPAAGGGALSWKPGPAVPANAVIGGQESGRNLPVCHASHQGGVHPGKVVAGKCNIGWGGKEIVLTSFEVLTNSRATLSWAAGPFVAANAVIGGKETGRTLPVCRGSHQGGVHPGKVVAGKCNIGWGGKEIVLTRFEVLIQK